MDPSFSPTDHSDRTPCGRKSRRTSVLTQEQVTRKRAIDRANQRVYRARNKAAVEQLHDRISDLTSELREAKALIHRQNAMIQSLGGQDVIDETHDDDQERALVAFHNAITDTRLLTPLCRNLPSSAEISFPEWALPVANTEPTNHVDELMVTYSRMWREQMLNSDWSPPELSDVRFPSIASLLNPTSSPSESDARPLADGVAAHLKRLMHIFPMLVERIAMLYKIAHLLRWRVCQTRETYEAMPEYLRPTRLQRTRPHPAWIDIITWPEARDAIIAEEEWFRSPDRFELYTRLTGSSISINWPYPDSGAILESPDGHARLHPLFEAHIRNVNNWTYGKEVGENFPPLDKWTRAPRAPAPSQV